VVDLEAANQRSVYGWIEQPRSVRANDLLEIGVEILHIEVDGRPIAFTRSGTGPALVLLHGFSHDSRVWRPQLEILSNRFTVIAWDAPGAGQSPDPPVGFGIGDWAACLAGVLEACGIDRAHILGLSWGGLVAQEIFRSHPRLVRSLVLADTYAGWAGSLPTPIPEERLAACLADSWLPPAEFVARYLPTMFSDSAPHGRAASWPGSWPTSIQKASG
jgi:pimeloyl-ACP methyl ester carboxylesterase